MRHVLFLMLSVIATVPAVAAQDSRDQINPVLKTCYESCRSEKDPLAHEGCMIQCKKADMEQPSQKPASPEKDRK